MMSQLQSKDSRQQPDLLNQTVDVGYQFCLAGIGAVSLGAKTGAEFLNAAIKRGETVDADLKRSVEKQAETTVDTLGKNYARLEKTVERNLSGVLNWLHIPTQDDISTLARRVAELTKNVKELQKTQAAKQATAG